MGRTLIGGTSISTAPATTSTGTAVTVNPSWSSRVQGLPLWVALSSAGNSFPTQLGIQVLDWRGENVTETPYSAAWGSGTDGYSNYYSSTQYLGMGEGYSGFNYQAPELYVQNNPSTSSLWGPGNVGFGTGWQCVNNLGNTVWNFDIDYRTNAPTLYRTGWSSTYSPYDNGNGGATLTQSGTWIGPEGTRQEHALISPGGNPNLYMIRNQRKKGGLSTWNHVHDVDNDVVSPWQYAGAAAQAAYAETIAHYTNSYGTRFSYNENTNRLAWVTGYSTYSSASRVIIWQGAEGKNLYDTPLKEWIEAATVEDYGNIPAPFTNMSGEGGYAARVYLTNSGKIYIHWKNSTNNYAYVIDPTSGSLVTTSLPIDGSTTSYSFDQGNMICGHNSVLSWDNKWLFAGHLYYYYHCGTMGHFVSMDDPLCHARISETASSYRGHCIPHGKSGFAYVNGGMTGSGGPHQVYNFEETYGNWLANGGTLSSPFHYKQRWSNYTSGVTAYSAGNFEKAGDTEYDLWNELVRRTNINAGGAVDPTSSTYQIPKNGKASWFVPTTYAGMMPLHYWYNVLPSGADNSKDAY